MHSHIESRKSLFVLLVGYSCFKSMNLIVQQS